MSTLNTPGLSAPDKLAFDHMIEVEPVWNGIGTARTELGLQDKTLLHAGPPIEDPNGIAIPILNSAVLAALYEGWCSSEDETEKLIRNGGIKLEPAQDHSAVVPLAGILSPSMFVQRICDQNQPSRIAYSPFNGGMAAPMRLGLRNAAVVDHWRWLNSEFADQIKLALEPGIPLIPLADHGLQQGDDCHGRTGAATAALLKQMEPRLPGTSGSTAYDYIANAPPFFLNLWMAAAKCILSAGVGVENSSIITAMAGNGNHTGLQIGGLPGRWFTAPADPPDGEIGAPYGQQDRLGAIGDSAVVDALGFGAMAFNFAPEQQKAMAAALPDHWRELPANLLFGINPKFKLVRPLMGLSAAHVAGQKHSPIVSLGILDRAGLGGRIGGGIYRVPVELFQAACSELPQAGGAGT